MKISSNRRAGFTLIEIMIVVAIIALLAAVAIPSFVEARRTAQKRACIKNLHQMEGAKEQWILENKKSAGTAVDISAVSAYLKGGTTPVCPAGGTYSYNVVNTDPACTISGHTL